MAVQKQKFNARFIFCLSEELLRLYVYSSPSAGGYYQARLPNTITPSESTFNSIVKMIAPVGSVVVEEVYIGYEM
jgi:hypothetical protein